MKKFQLLLLDANIVIELFRLGIWEKVIDSCDIHLARSVAEDEAHFYLDEYGQRQDFDLKPYADNGRITIFDVVISELNGFCSQFDLAYMEKLDPGEAESLAYLVNSKEKYLICSADRIVYRVLGNLNREEQGISLEEILQKIGLGRSLSRQFSKACRENWTKQGAQEGIQGRGLKNSHYPHSDSG
ncbi:MAG: hypothetical protein K8S55_14450 [Phycisphaerae bacterium]|nr:hypothetical protein [Phycisphaerae bacterium]